MPLESRKSMSKSSNTSLLGWWMDAITVRPSLARPRSVCVTKNADELHMYTIGARLISTLLPR